MSDFRDCNTYTAFIRNLIGLPYWYGTHLQSCTQSLLDRKSAQFPDWYSAARIAGCKEDIPKKLVASDCVGIVTGYMWTDGGNNVLESIGTGRNIPQDNGSNGCPDTSANGMFNFAKNKGAKWGHVDTIPELRGLALWSEGHLGIYVGHGSIIEFRGFEHGCVETSIEKRNFVYWYELPFLKYSTRTNVFFIKRNKVPSARIVL